MRYRDILPIRASAYIISIFNEQIGKGAMAYYLKRRDKVPVWEVASVMLFVMFCETFYLLFWATVGYLTSGPALPAAFGLVPWLAAAAGAGVRPVGGCTSAAPSAPARSCASGASSSPSGRPTSSITRCSCCSAPPALLAAVFVYTTALRLFGVDASFPELLGYLPVIFFAAAVPTPMRAAAITSWVILFPRPTPARWPAFGLVQHNFFILFNALIGVAFWRRAQRDLFG